MVSYTIFLIFFLSRKPVCAGLTVCSGSRDHVFALRNVLNSKLLLGIEVSYGETYEVMIIEVTVRMLERQGRAETTYLVGLPELQLPGWFLSSLGVSVA